MAKTRFVALSMGILAMGFLAGPAAGATWTPIIGIPAPPFGINEGQPASGPVSTSAPTGTVTGPATFKLSGNVGTIDFRGVGSPSAWIYVTSADPNNPVTVDGLTAQGSYVIFDHIKIVNSGGGFLEGSDHLVVRNSEIVGVIGNGSNGSGGGFGFGTWTYGGSATASYMVFDHNNVHDVGDVNATTDIDNHCLVVNGAVDHLWVTNNTFTKCGGDSMQLEAQSGKSAKIHHVYYGKNVSSTNRQSGGWVKHATDVIFSQNVAHDMKAGSGGTGPCYGGQYSAIRTWFIFNECYTAPLGIMLASADPPDPFGPVYILGNYIHDLASSDTNPYNSGGLSLRLGGTVIAAHNTITRVGTLSGVNVLPGQTITLSSNILPGPAYSEGTVNADHNLVASVTDPRNVPGAVDAGVVSSAYATFQSLYGISIAVDFDGNSRPAGGQWDIGAFESSGQPPLPTLSINDVSVTEGNSGTTLANFTVTLSAASSSVVSVNYATANGSATAGSDYVAASGTLTFPAGTTTKTIPVTVNGDTVGEPDETFFVNLSAASGATIADAQGMGTILNDDVQPTLSINDVSVTEGNSGTKPATFTVTLSAASASPVSVSYATANGTATAGSDYVATGGTVTFPAGSTTQTLVVTINGDTTVEPNETFFVNLSAPSGATILDGQGVGTILNDDTATLPTLSIADVSVNEGNSGTTPANFVVTLSAAASSSVTVNYATANGTATAGSDYVAQTGSLTFAVGQTTKTIAVTVNGDTTVEPNETFTVTLSAPTGATLARATATGTILNDDSALIPQLSINDVSVTEGNSGTTTATFTVTLSPASSSPVTVNFATADGTATAGTDYVAKTGTLTLLAGQTTGTINVTVNGDTTVEPDETFTVNLTGAVGATIADAQGVATIVNDDSASATQAVTWTSIVGALANGGTETKTAATGWGNAGAVSSKALASGDGYVEFTAAEVGTHRILGLSHGNNNQSWADIDFGLYLYANGPVQVYENGALKGNFANFAAGDKFRVSIASGAVKFWRNGTLFYTSVAAPVYPLLVGTALYNQGATIANTVLSGNWAATGPEQAVVWTSMVGVSASGGSLTKTATTGWGNAGAISSTALASGDGYVEFTATETTTHRTLGLSNGNTNQNWDDIDFGLYLYANGPVQVYEKGVFKGAFGTFVSGDKLRVSVASGVVKYWRNGTLFYTSAAAPVFPLLVDSALYTQGATIANTVVSGNWAAPGPEQAVVWTSMVGVSANGGTLTKTAATGWANAGAVSSKALASGDGYVEFTATETTTHRILGLSNGNTNQNWDDVDFGLYLYASGPVQVYEKGVFKGTFGTFVSGDKLRVSVASGVVKYWKNGTLLYASVQAPTYPLLVDTALYTQGATVTNAVVSGNFQ